MKIYYIYCSYVGLTGVSLDIVCVRGTLNISSNFKRILLSTWWFNKEQRQNGLTLLNTNGVIHQHANRNTPSANQAQKTMRAPQVYQVYTYSPDLVSTDFQIFYNFFMTQKIYTHKKVAVCQPFYRWEKNSLKMVSKINLRIMLQALKMAISSLINNTDVNLIHIWINNLSGQT